MDKKTAEEWIKQQPIEELTEEAEFVLANHPDLTGRVKMLWHNNYYDGALSGIAKLDGEDLYWFNCVADFYNYRLDWDDSCDECDCDEQVLTPCTRWERLYAVYKLTDEQSRLHTDQHNLFRKHVGTHTDYDDNGIRPVGTGVKPQSEWHKFYKAEHPKIPPVTNEQLVGWTTSLWESEDNASN